MVTLCCAAVVVVIAILAYLLLRRDDVRQYIPYQRAPPYQYPPPQQYPPGAAAPLACPSCGAAAIWDSRIGRYRCPTCGRII